MPTADPPDRADPELDAIIPDSSTQPYDMGALIRRVVDDGELLELQEDWAQNIVCGLARLSTRFKTAFDVEQSVDPSLIGGVRITIGDKLADGTVAGRLDDIARLLSTN